MYSIPSIIQEIQSCEEIYELKSIMISIQNKLNYDYVLCNIQLSSSFNETYFLLLSNFPDSWMKHYQEENYDKVDPVLEHCITKNTPICWHEFYEYKEDVKINKLFTELCEAGLVGGVSVGLRMSSGEVGIISMAKKEVILKKSKEYYQAALYITTLQPYIHDALKRLSHKYQEQRKQPRLTKRELECLHWIADGKTSTEIASILNLSESTITFHIKNIISKLKVNNRIQAVAKAVLLDIISPKKSNQNQSIYFL